MKINVEIPNDLSEITLRQYKHFLKIQKKVTDEKFLGAKIVEIFCNVKLEDVLRLKVADSELITSTLSNMFEQKPKLVRHFKLGKTNYGFHPTLDDMTLGEYIDLDNNIGDWENIEKAMNVLYRPVELKVKDKYTIKEYDIEKYETMLDMPMDAVLSSIFFLWNLGLELTKHITNSLEQEEAQALTQYLTSELSGVGITHFMDSLKGTLQDLKILLN